MRKFKITNPYADVDWDNWHHYKTNLHTHSTASDSQVDFSDMIKAYYDAGFDILAMTDHGVINHGWNLKPRRVPLFSVASIIKKPTWLTDEEYSAILDGTYKKPRPRNDRPALRNRSEHRRVHKVPCQRLFHRFRAGTRRARKRF